MGFERIVKVFTLKFDDPAYAGLEVKMRSLTTRQFLEVTSLADAVQDKSATSVAGEAKALISAAAAAMVSWNLEDDGVPVPATEDGLVGQEFEFVFNVILAWLNAIASVPPPLPQPSSDGGKSLEASLTMAPLSPSRSS